MVEIRKYDNSIDRHEVVELWENIFGYKEPRNDPGFSIDQKLKVNDGLFFVARENNKVIGTIIGGYDGHRGWIYSLAVLESKRNQKVGTRLLNVVEKELQSLGCVKINLQIVSSNKIVKDFYKKNGYKIEERISMGKVL